MATLIAGGYVSGSEGDTITTANTGASTVPGTLTPLTISTTYKATSGRSFRSNGATVFGYGNWTLSSHSDEFASIYFVLDGTPGGTGYPIEVRNGADSAFAYRIGFDTSRRMVITNVTTITTTSTFALTVGTEYLFEVNAAGAGDLSVSIYDVATYTLQEALTPGALTATTFSKFRQGCAASVAGAGLSYHMDVVLSDTAFAPRIVRGTSAPTLAAATCAASGTVDTGVTGTIGVTLAAATCAATGTLTVSGTSAPTLSAATSAAAGTVSATGTVAVTLGTATAAATGTLTVTGTAASTLGAATSAGAGSVSATGTIGVTLAPATCAASGSVDTGVGGTVAVTLGAATCEAAGFLVVFATSSNDLAPATMVATGATGVPIFGTVGVTLGAATAAAAGTLTVIGSSSATLAAATMVAAGLAGDTVSGTIAVTLGAATAVATGTLTDVGTSSGTLNPATMAASGTLTVSGSLGVTLAPATSSASGTLTVVGTIAATLNPATAVVVGYIATPPDPNPEVVYITTVSIVRVATSAAVHIVTCGPKVRIDTISTVFAMS